MIEVTAYGPSSTVPLKPISATSVALNSTTYTDNPQYPTHGYQRKSYQHTQGKFLGLLSSPFLIFGVFWQL